MSEAGTTPRDAADAGSVKDAGTTVVSLEQVEVRWPGGAWGLQDVSFALGAGERVALVGSSGAGKSTLLRVCNGLVPVRAGRVRTLGVDVMAARGRALRALRRRVGMVFQRHALVERRTVIENVLMAHLGAMSPWAVLRGDFPEEVVDEAFGLLDETGLGGLAHRRVDALSGGQQQRVGIARALLQRPDLLLVDEPTASLDPHLADAILGLITRLATERGISVIINLHDLPLARAYATRVVGLRSGRVVWEGEPSALDEAAQRVIYTAER